MCKVPPGCQMFSLTDCCHSGTILDLPLDVRLDCKINHQVKIVSHSPKGGKVTRTAAGAVELRSVPFATLLQEDHLRLMAAKIEKGRHP